MGFKIGDRVRYCHLRGNVVGIADDGGVSVRWANGGESIRGIRNHSLNFSKSWSLCLPEDEIYDAPATANTEEYEALALAGQRNV